VKIVCTATVTLLGFLWNILNKYLLFHYHCWNTQLADLYGKEADEHDCPSTKPASQGTEADNRRKIILVSSKVRCTMTCHKCRCIYSKTKHEQIALKRVQESRLYTCGSSIFLPNSACHDTVCVEESFTCGDPIELYYFSATLVHFPLVCYYCEMPEDSLVRDDECIELERNYQTVHTMCILCKHDKKHPFTRNLLNAPKHKKKSSL